MCFLKRYVAVIKSFCDLSKNAHHLLILPVSRALIPLNASTVSALRMTII
jgi:hypothetical protein